MDALQGDRTVERREVEKTRRVGGTWAGQTWGVTQIPPRELSFREDCDLFQLTASHFVLCIHNTFISTFTVHFPVMNQFLVEVEMELNIHAKV